MAKARFVQDGQAIDHTPVSAVTAGDVVVVGTVPLVAKVDIAANALGSLSVDGVFDVVKDSSTFSAGDAVYWDENGSPVGGVALSGAASSSASGNHLMGLAIADAATGASTVRVKLTAAKRTATIAGSVTADDITGSDSSLAIVGRPGVGAGTAGAVVVTGGDSAGGTGTAGALTLDAGAASGGTPAGITIGGTNATAVTVGAASVALVAPGPQTRGIGASTAAAGTTFADAGALPAGTAEVYPTTGADNTTGVIINAADKVDGRKIMIGNGVSDKILKVYGPSGATINGAGANAAFSSASGKGVIAVCLSSSGNTWLMW